MNWHKTASSDFLMCLFAEDRRGLSDRSFLRVQNFADAEPWRTLLARNSPDALSPEIPIFLAQGEADTLVLPPVTRDYMARLCRAGSMVQLYWMPGVGHLYAARDSALTAIDWITNRFRGAPAPTSCNVGREGH